MVYYKMTEISVEHILLFVVIVCFINYFMGSSRCGFSVGAPMRGDPCTTQSGFKVGGQGVHLLDNVVVQNVLRADDGAVHDDGTSSGASGRRDTRRQRR
jgi:hypothetical protein